MKLLTRIAFSFTVLFVNTVIVFAGGIPADIQAESYYTPVPQGELSQSNTEYTQDTVPDKPGNTFVAGTIKQIQNNILSLDTDEGVREFIIADNGYVMNGTLGFSTQTLAPGEQITVNFDSQETITSIEKNDIMSAETSVKNIAKDIIVIGIVSMLLAAVITHIFAKPVQKPSSPLHSPRLFGI